MRKTVSSRLRGCGSPRRESGGWRRGGSLQAPAQVTESSHRLDRGGAPRGDGSLYQGNRSGNMSATAAARSTRTTAATRALAMNRSPDVIGSSLGSFVHDTF